MDVEGLPQEIRVETPGGDTSLSAGEWEEVDVEDVRHLEVHDPEGRLTPLGLGSVLDVVLGERDIASNPPELSYEGPQTWAHGTTGSVGPTIEPLPLSFLRTASRYDGDTDTLRGLMRHCDDLLSALPSVLEEGDQLDSLLWEWFQDPPARDHYAQTMNDLLTGLLQNLSGSSPDQGPDEPSPSKEGFPSEPAEEPDDHSGEAAQNNAGDGGDENYSAPLDVDDGIVEDFLTEANEHLGKIDNLLVEVEDDPDADTLDELFRSMHTLKGGFGFCGLDMCGELTHAAEDLLDELRGDPPEEVPAVWMDLFFRTVDSVRNIVEALERARDTGEDHLEADRSESYLSDLRTDLRQACDGTTDPDEFRSLDAEPEDDATGSDLGDETVTLELETVEEIVDLMGELVISQSSLSETLAGKLNREEESALKEQKKIIEQLQRRTMNLRLLPVGQAFERLPRLVRDLARNLDKEIDLHLSGGDVEMDKSMIEGIQDPLIHLIRNACDHGIESPEERRKKGKSETGNLYVRAYHEGGMVHVEVEDDGAGLDRDAIAEKAVDQDMIPPDHDLDPGEVDELIVTPGFSTTEEASEVSGRGVGMDVVASEIRDLRGTVDIESTPGEGTRVTLELPLTVAIIDGLIVQVGGQRLIVPVSDVHQTVNPEPSELRSLDGNRRVLHWNDRVIPVVRPGQFIKGLESTPSEQNRPLYVLVGDEGDSHALAIDQLIGYEQVVIKDLEERELANHPLITGAAILGDGHVCFILDVKGLVRLHRTRREASDDPSVASNSPEREANHV